ncbi:hypothetical protein [Azospirillum melinis]
MYGIQKELIVAMLSFASSIIVGLIVPRLQPKASIRYSVKHAFNFFVEAANNNQSFIVQTRSVLITNNGRGTAKDVEIVLAFRPDMFKVWPPCFYASGINDENYFFIKIPRMTNKTSHSLEILQIRNNEKNIDPPNVISVTHEGGSAQPIEVQAQPIITKRVRYIALFLMFLGAAFCFYAVYSTGIYLWNMNYPQPPSASTITVTPPSKP